MVYNDFQGIKLSSLGMGCMRLPTFENAEIDIEATREMVAYAIKKGINYFDTAWPYHGGKSETVIGELLSEYPREKFYLASKFPGFDLSTMERVEEIFEKQLEKCRVDYFDFYLFHNVCDRNIDGYLDEKYGIFDYLIKQKRNGRIKHLGFSAHGDMKILKRFLDAYGKDMEFCQLQVNWLDWTYQSAKEKIDFVSSYGIPIWVMEPVRGGTLVSLKSQYEKVLKAFRPEATNAEWAFRFLQTVPEVKMILSGMSDFEQLRENIATFEESKPLNDEEMTAILDIAKDMTENKVLRCTSCRYCTEHCPQGLNIPWIIGLYNDRVFIRNEFVAPQAIKDLPEDKQPSACLGCRACEDVCPQNLKISDMMSDFADKLR